MGFTGLIRLKDIENDYNIFPDCKGLYIIYIDDNQDIGFYNPGTGGVGLSNKLDTMQSKIR